MLFKYQEVISVDLSSLTNTCIFPSGPWRLTDVSPLIEFSLFSGDMDLAGRGEKETKTKYFKLRLNDVEVKD